MIRGRLRRDGEGEKPSHDADEYIEIDPRELTEIFKVPQWLRDLGLTSCCWSASRCTSRPWWRCSRSRR